MANTTSGTATFDKTFAIDEIEEEAFERIGQQNVSGYQLKNARRTLNKTTGAISVLRAARTRVTSIQGRGEAGSVLLLHDAATTGAAASGNLKATYKFETEGLDIMIPGSGILFENGVCATLTQTSGTDGSVTMTITGA